MKQREIPVTTYQVREEEVPGENGSRKVSYFVPVTFMKKTSYYEPVQETSYKTVERRFDLKAIEVFDTTGEAVPCKVFLARLLKKDLAVVVVTDRKIDPLFRETLKKGTFVVAVRPEPAAPPPPPTVVPQPVPPPVAPAPAVAPVAPPPGPGTPPPTAPDAGSGPMPAPLSTRG
jgi:hypothetical protein